MQVLSNGCAWESREKRETRERERGKERASSALKVAA
jgi:hypothetical protein|eukprot:COSAG06_NODE_1645_length_8819_cov_7.547018_2_plen_37_part_00